MTEAEATPGLAAEEPRAVVRVRGLSVESVTEGRAVEVLRRAELDLFEGEVVLLVGPSGSGKSLFTKLIAGLLGRGTDTLHLAAGAEISITLKDGVSRDVIGSARYPTELRGAIGYMFQYHALFDELSVEQNIRLGLDLARTRRPRAEASAWLADRAHHLKLDRLLGRSIEPLSGGQRQRVSLLRTLALRPELLIYDEPTSGLDPDTARRVAELVREVQHGPEGGGVKAPGEGAASPELPRLSIVVTHDYEHLLGIADRVVLLDTDRGFAVIETPDAASREAARVRIVEALACFEPATPRPLSAHQARAVRREAEWERLRSAPGRMFDLLRTMPARYLRLWRWHGRFGWSAFRLLIIGAIPFLVLGGTAIGMILSYFSLNAIPRALQTKAEPVFIEEMIRTLGVALYQILAPLFTAICLAARSGAAVAGHVSNLERSAQLDALRVLGLPPAALYADKIVIAFAVGMPLLTALAFCAATLSCMGVILLTRPLATWYTFEHSFFSGLAQHAFDLPYAGTEWVLCKLVPAGILTGLIAWSLGAGKKATSEDVNRAITKAIMRGILCVITVFFLVLLVEMNVGRS
ncbi:MAG: ATP-binding cassette domain-containing protein [Planctomycetota bacterium]|jgi:ABC-type lipoprotein export system ATPase subunit/ABC-type transporter Mla maintaining outer membrane lipid asymmetry permease subunit MlaE